MKKGWKVGMNTTRASSRGTEDLGIHGAGEGTEARAGKKARRL